MLSFTVITFFPSVYRSGIRDLTLNNFTWMKEPLGVSEEYEQIRHASAKSVPCTVSSAHGSCQKVNGLKISRYEEI